MRRLLQYLDDRLTRFEDWSARSALATLATMMMIVGITGLIVIGLALLLS